MENISPKKLQELLQEGAPIHLVDVREPAEHQEFNIGGTLLPLGQILGMQTDDIDDLRDTEIICYCRSGQRSMQACLMLETIGFSHVRNLQGGMNLWREEVG